MGAFILATIVAVGTILISGCLLFGASMSDSPTSAADVPVKSTFFIGMACAGLIAASHWMPHIGW